MRDKAWLEKELVSGLMKFNENPFLTEFDRGHIHGISLAQALVYQLDEPKITEEQAWNKIAESYPADAKSLSVAFEHFYYEGFSKKELPVIPQFVADWIERNKQPDYEYENKEDALADSIHFTLYSLEANYPETNPNVILRKPVNEWLDNDRKNYWKLIDAVRYGYEVEKEKRYHVVNKENYFMLRKYDGLVDILHISSSMSRDEYEKDTRFMLTEKEIKDYDKRYWAFAEEVTE